MDGKYKLCLHYQTWTSYDEEMFDLIIAILELAIKELVKFSALLKVIASAIASLAGMLMFWKTIHPVHFDEFMGINKARNQQKDMVSEASHTSLKFPQPTGRYVELKPTLFERRMMKRHVDEWKKFIINGI